MSELEKVGKEASGTVPPGGKRRKVTEKRMMRSMPMKKVGREKLVREPVTQKVSKAEPLLWAATIPNRMPMMIARMVELPSKRRVLNRRPEVMTSVEMLCPLVYEYPNWKVSVDFR